MEIPRKSARPKKPKKFFEDELYDSRQCSVCNTESNVKPGSLLKCQVCVRWMHSFCVQMTQEILGQWKKMAESFICRKCCFSGLDRFNYQESLRRIQRSSEGKIIAQAKSELLLLKTYNVVLSEINDSPRSGNIDNVSREILKMTHPVVLTEYNPLETGSDGNCLYRAVSRGLFGHEQEHELLRLLTATEFILNRNVYDENSWDYTDFISDCRVVTSPYRDILKSAVTNGAYAELIHMYAISAVLGSAIRSYYPPTVKTELLTEPFSRKVVGRNVKTSAAPVVTIMWTQCMVPRRENFQFMPNHFVPLCPLTKTIVPNETLDTEWPSLSNSVSSAKSVEDLQECLNDCESSDDCVPPVNLTTEQSTTSNSDKCIESINCLDSSSASSHECQMSSNSNLLQNEVVEPEVYTSTPKNTASEPSFIVHTSCDVSAISEPTESLKPGFVPCDGPFRGKLQKERFLEINEVMELFQNNNGSLSQVPAGIKENMFFLVNNSENERRKAQGKKQTFWDDCGSWTKGTSPRDLFLFQDGKLTNIVKHHGIYCTKRHSKRVPVYEPLAPQPNEEDVFVVQRAYSKHKTSLTYRRRITWIGNIPATMTLSLNPVALIEYVGLFPGRSLHGNTKHPDKNEEYIRVSDKARSIIKEKVKTQNPKNVYDELNIDAERSIHDLPRNLKQVQNFRYQEKKKERKNTHKTDNYHHNLADHVLNAENMVYTHPYVKAVTHLPSGPSVILYLDEQILDLKRFCCNKESTVLCVDKTFNLGDLFLTATVFKNTALTRLMTGEPPLFIGPAFLHGKSDFETFFHVFSHLSSLLSESEIGNMIIGTDDETAMRNGIRRAFPNATQILCTRHLKNNVLHYLKDKVGVIEKDRRRILSALFGDEGITHADDSVIAEHRVDQARQVITEVARTFIPYFEKRVLPLLLDYVVYPSNIKSIDANWTNNNAESINNILKIGTDWKPQPLTTLILTIYKKVHSQYKDSQHALIGRGNFKLTLPFIRNRVSIDVYCRMTKEERYAIFLKFLKDKGRRKERTVTASNGLITVPLTPRAGKKKLQKRGKKTERCHSKKAKFNPNKSE